MALKYAILSQLLNDEVSGYDIAKRFDASVAYFWQASHQQIYKTLALMVEDGCLNYRAVTQSAKPDRKLYTITDQGRQALTLWVSKKSKPAPIKESFLVKLLTVDLVGSGVLIHEAKEMLIECDALLETYHNIESEHYSQPEQKSPLSRSYYLTLRRGITSVAARRQWLEEVIEQLLVKM